MMTSPADTPFRDQLLVHYIRLKPKMNLLGVSVMELAQSLQEDVGAEIAEIIKMIHDVVEDDSMFRLTTGRHVRHLIVHHSLLEVVQ